MIVEFVGLPSSGKSTIVESLEHLLEDEFPQRKKMPSGVVGRVARKLTVIVRWFPAVALTVYALASDHRPWPAKWQALRWFVTTLEKYRCREEGLTLIAEGAVQRALLVLHTPGRGHDRALLARYVRSIPVADMVVVLGVDAAEAAKRLRARRNDPADGRARDRFSNPDRDLAETLEESDRFLGEVMSLLQPAVPEATVVQIWTDGLEPLSIQIEALAARIRQKVSHRLARDV